MITLIGKQIWQNIKEINQVEQLVGYCFVNNVTKKQKVQTHIYVPNVNEIEADPSILHPAY